jgi:hypothetical protein
MYRDEQDKECKWQMWLKLSLFRLIQNLHQKLPVELQKVQYQVASCRTPKRLRKGKISLLLTFLDLNVARHVAEEAPG